MVAIFRPFTVVYSRSFTVVHQHLRDEKKKEKEKKANDLASVCSLPLYESYYPVYQE